MQTWEIHMGGLVQGVGFRPLVSQLAERMQLNGWVSNTNNGVYIRFNADQQKASEFYHHLLKDPPANAIISNHELREISSQHFTAFSINHSINHQKPDLLLTPDIAICPQCKKDMRERNNPRFHYPFTTCLNCGPRYSILTNLPYDRPNTTMASLQLCTTCRQEYNDIHNRRHYSQTNSCPVCSIPMHLYNSSQEEIASSTDDILDIVNQALVKGMIVAVKGIGGYLLLCDASNACTIETLRDRKRRPAKPFALLYQDISRAEKDVYLSEKESGALLSKAAPIVLCKMKDGEGTAICKDLIAPGLNRIGVMLPYTGLLALIAQAFEKPLIATSGNISGSPILHKDEDALHHLLHFADLLLSFDREIVTPQDDSVLQFSEQEEQKIFIRRSRGYAPNYYPNTFASQECILATGGELKSAFALVDNNNLYVSQYLGDQESYDAHLVYKDTMQHLLRLLQCKPEHILVDKHPSYSVAAFGRDLAEELQIPFTEVQHHKAHFAAVLAENDLLHTNDPVLGVVWDGTGYGEDQQIWGSEFFLLEDQQIERIAHFDYFPQLLGDKMSREPRLSAVSIWRQDLDRIPDFKEKYSEAEWSVIYKHVQQPQHLLTSSMGRLLDGIASFLGIQQINTYESEAAMKLEALATTSDDKSFDYYPIPLTKNRLDWRMMMHEIIEDKMGGVPAGRIAYKVFVSLAYSIRQVAIYNHVNKVAFSGGVFQNALLVDLVTQVLQEHCQLYFHRQLSPNDECIGFGQMASYCMEHAALASLSNNSIYQTT